MVKRITVILGVGLVALMAMVLSAAPSLSQQSSVEARLHELGVPADAELGVVSMDNEGTFWDVTYFDSSGKEHVLIKREGPKATPAPGA